MNNKQEIRDGYIWTKQNCPICNVRPSGFVGKRGGASHREGLGVETEIWKCGSCGLMFPDPMPFPENGLGQHYDVAADDYFAKHEKSGKFAAADALLEKAESILGRKGKLLDVGIGRGEILAASIERGWKSEGVEPSATFADYAEKATGAKIWRQPVEQADIQADSFDVVILGAVLEHLYDPVEIIRKISIILRPGGLLFVDVPNEDGLYFKVGNFYQKCRGRDWCVNLAPTFSPFHIFGFNAKSLKKLLGQHGFTVSQWSVYGGSSGQPDRENRFESCNPLERLV
jgi:SAM-dependent methyltransferase